MTTLFDPICAMTVDDRALRVDGYDELGFCSEGCRRVFLAERADPSPAAASHECCGGCREDDAAPESVLS